MRTSRKKSEMIDVARAKRKHKLPFSDLIYKIIFIDGLRNANRPLLNDEHHNCQSYIGNDFQFYFNFYN